jgi:exodeoxyribonuclease V gamma subunit
MQAMFDSYTAELRTWPEAARDASVDYLPDGLPESLRVIDTLSQMRLSTQGDSCRLVVHSGSLIKQQQYEYKSLVTFWIDHLAGHLSGGPLNTVIVSRAGTVHLAPLSPEVARQHWAKWLKAWQLGHRQPLPLAPKSAFAWLKKGGNPSDVAYGAGHDAYPAACAAYEDHDPEFGKFGEREGNAHLARAFPDFEALWAEGQFAIWADELLKPLMDHLKPSGSKKVSGEGAQ